MITALGIIERSMTSRVGEQSLRHENSMLLLIEK